MPNCPGRSRRRREGRAPVGPVGPVGPGPPAARGSTNHPPAEFAAFARAAANALGARDAHLYVADYALRRLQHLDGGGATGEPIPVAGTLAGRAFISGEVVATSGAPSVLTVPLTDGAERIGVLQLEYDDWDGTIPEHRAPVMMTFVAMLIGRGRYTDEWVRARRSEALTAAAEIQWDLLPPLSCETPSVAVSGILEPAHDIGGDPSTTR